MKSILINLPMEKVFSELTVNLVLWQIFVLIVQISIVVLLYKFVVWIFKKRKEV